MNWRDTGSKGSSGHLNSIIGGVYNEYTPFASPATDRVSLWFLHKWELPNTAGRKDTGGEVQSGEKGIPLEIFLVRLPLLLGVLPLPPSSRPSTERRRAPGLSPTPETKVHPNLCHHPALPTRPHRTPGHEWSLRRKGV